MKEEKIDTIFNHKMKEIDKERVLDAIIYFEWKQLQKEQQEEKIEENYEEGEEQASKETSLKGLGKEEKKAWNRLRELILSASEVYEQFYRFSIQYDELELVDKIEIIWRKIQELNQRRVLVSRDSLVTEPILNITEQGIVFAPSYQEEMEEDKNDVKAIYDRLKQLQSWESENTQAYATLFEETQKVRRQDKNYPVFFYHGIDNKKEVIQSIFYYHAKELSEIMPQMDEQEQKALLKREAKKTYKQFYRFVDLNDASVEKKDLNNYAGKVDNQKLEEILDTQLEEIIGMQRQKRANLSGENQSEEPLSCYKCIEANGLEKGFDKKEDDGNNYWTQRIFEELKKLEVLQREDPIAYYEKWIETKLYRARERNDAMEIEMVRKIYQAFEIQKERLEKGITSPEGQQIG
ncbi:MAG: hypothetical protein ACLU84_00795 [Clostridia bacterium]